MRNEFGDEISEDQLEEFTSRIRNLEDKEIDRLWHEIGFVIADHADDLKALRWKDIHNIRKSEESAKVVVENLLFETSLEDFEEELRKLES